MKKPSSFLAIRNRIEKYLPMTLGSFLLFAIILYFLYIVGQTTIENYYSNQSIAVEETKITDLEHELTYMQYEINYFKTRSFKEKEAREKLGYRAPGEKVISLPFDKPEDKLADEVLVASTIRVPNYRLWWSYFFRRK